MDKATYKHIILMINLKEVSSNKREFLCGLICSYNANVHQLINLNALHSKVMG